MVRLGSLSLFRVLLNTDSHATKKRLSANPPCAQQALRLQNLSRQSSQTV